MQPSPSSSSFSSSSPSGRPKMDATIPTPAASSTVTNSSSIISLQIAPFQVLEINLISAQDLAPITKSMRTYAVAWINPNKKLITRIDQKGHTNPKWNDKLAFRVDEKILNSDKSSLTIEIYTVSWFRDVLVGTVCVVISNLIAPFHTHSNKKFVALQIRHPSGYPQGILNMGFSLLDSTMRSLPLDSDLQDNSNEKQDTRWIIEEETQQQLNEKIQLWRSLSDGGTYLMNEDFTVKDGSVCDGSAVNGSMCNGSMFNGSELCSDVGPSASIVAAEIANGQKQRQPMQPPEIPPRRVKVLQNEIGSSILGELTPEEAATTRWRKDVSPRIASTRRNSGGGGLFSCFGTAYGIEFRIVCGASNPCSDTINRSRSSSKSTSRRTKSGDQHSV